MNTERVATPGERELTRFREEIRALHADEVDLLRVEETIVKRLKVIGAEMMLEAMKVADTEASEVIVIAEETSLDQGEDAEKNAENHIRAE